MILPLTSITADFSAPPTLLAGTKYPMPGKQSKYSKLQTGQDKAPLFDRAFGKFCARFLSRNLLIPVIFLFLFITAGPSVYSQSSCSEKLELAQGLFTDGKINLVEETISGCLANGFTRDEKIEAYKLLSITYTYLEEDAKADEAVLNLLRVDKEYRVNPDLDPTEFINLYKLYRTYPILKVGLKGIGNYNLFGVTSAGTQFPDQDANAGVLESSIGIGGGIDVEIPYKDFLEIVPSIYFHSRNYTYTLNQSNGEINGEFGIGSYIDKQSWLELPVLVRYKYVQKKIHPYGELGFSLGYLVQDELTTLSADRKEGAAVQGPNLDRQNFRNQLNYAITAGAGIKFDIPMSEIVIGVRYNYAMNDLTRKNESIPDPLLTEYGIEEPIYKINSFSFFIGFMRKIYKPKKIYEY